MNPTAFLGRIAPDAAPTADLRRLAAAAAARTSGVTLLPLPGSLPGRTEILAAWRPAAEAKLPTMPPTITAAPRAHQRAVSNKD